MEFIETFNACLGHYFGADKHFMVMMMIVTVRLIWLGTIVTWRSCRPLVLILNKITMGMMFVLIYFLHVDSKRGFFQNFLGYNMINAVVSLYLGLSKIFWGNK